MGDWHANTRRRAHDEQTDTHDEHGALSAPPLEWRGGGAGGDADRLRGAGPGCGRRPRPAAPGEEAKGRPAAARATRARGDAARVCQAPGQAGPAPPPLAQVLPRRRGGCQGPRQGGRGPPGLWRVAARAWVLEDSGERRGIHHDRGRLCACGRQRWASGHYLRVGCNGRPESVHNLVCRAFKGGRRPNRCPSTTWAARSCPWPSAGRTIAPPTSIGRRPPSRRATRASTRPAPMASRALCGRSWAASSRTSRLRTTRRPPSARRSGFRRRPRRPRRSGSTRAPVAVLNGKAKTVPGTDNKRYTGTWDPDLADLEGEEWKEEGTLDSQSAVVSNYGRDPAHLPWGAKAPSTIPSRRTPTAT